MSFAAGVYSLFTPGNPVVTNTTISSSTFNSTMNDIATALSTCVLKDGSQVITANIPMSSFKFTGLAAGTTSGNSVRYEQVLLLAGGTMTGNLLFTDATYDIGASGATRPRDLFLSRNAVIGGTLDVISTLNAGSLNSTGSLGVLNTTAIPAGGTASFGLRFSSISNFGVFFGSSAPTLAAAQGSLYLRSDGTTTNDRAYINTNGSTTWTALTTAA